MKNTSRLTPPTKSGFSLVELSIVLVILGLLVGGVLSGQSLIRAAQLRAVTTEYERYFTATRAFRDKYFAIPGDMTNATTFWGATASCPDTAGTGTQTCNGNGDGRLSNAPAVSQYGEWFMFWQHLANAGLIEGTYSGIAGAANTLSHNTSNSPSSKLSMGLWMASDNATFSAIAFPIATARHNFVLGGIAGSWPYGRLITPSEMWNIDTKMDDGKPALGKVTGALSSYVSIPNCSTDDTLAAQYELTLSSKECVIFIDAGL